AYRYESGKYVYKKSTTLPVKDRYSYSRYYGSVTFSKTGRWRIRAYHNDADHAATYSTYDYITVK
ncbi:MAG TPA: hypothetical protein VLA05_00980, partial [Coriobacteriia bacterium]|nr:hypothetical protein [Coriobacteriia bacterium]